MPALNCCTLTFLTLNMSHTCTYHWMLLAIVTCDYHTACLSLAVDNITCINAGHGPSPVQKIVQHQTKATLDQSGPVPGPGPVLTLLKILWYLYIIWCLMCAT